MRKKVKVRPRPLTLGIYVHALVVSGLDEGQPWEGSAADALALLDVLCESVVVDDPSILPELASEQWARVEGVRERALAMAGKIREQCEEALMERAPEQLNAGRHKLLRTLGVMQPSERAPLMQEPLAVSLALVNAGAVQAAADKVIKDALDSVRRN